jgi:hypothetical protein
MHEEVRKSVVDKPRICDATSQDEMVSMPLSGRASNIVESRRSMRVAGTDSTLKRGLQVIDDLPEYGQGSDSRNGLSKRAKLEVSLTTKL